MILQLQHQLLQLMICIVGFLSKAAVPDAYNGTNEAFNCKINVTCFLFLSILN